jgi:hypothetical protein
MLALDEEMRNPGKEGRASQGKRKQASVWIYS